MIEEVLNKIGRGATGANNEYMFHRSCVFENFSNISKTKREEIEKLTMKVFKRVECVLEVVTYPGDLSDVEIDLIHQAVKTAQTAHAPYSEFYVGAAIELENGVVICGSNQENAAFPSGLCAERVAFFTAGAQYPGVKIRSLAITAQSVKHNATNPAVPCGACLQVLREVEKRQKTAISVILKGMGNEVFKAESIAHFLPFSFDL